MRTRPAKPAKRTNGRHLPSGMTVAAARDLRMKCEQELLTCLRRLAESTGLDVRNVEVIRHAVPVSGNGDSQVVPVAVRIDLTV